MGGALFSHYPLLITVRFRSAFSLLTFLLGSALTHCRHSSTRPDETTRGDSHGVLPLYIMKSEFSASELRRGSAPLYRLAKTRKQLCQLASRTTPLIIRAQHNVLISNLHISSSRRNFPALTCENSTRVHIRHVFIEHSASAVGIQFSRCNRIWIEDVSILARGRSRPSRCKRPNNVCNNVHGTYSADVVMHRVRVEGGSTGIGLHACPRARLSAIVGLNVLGPFPRGQCVQFSRSHGASLDQFLCRNEANRAWTEDSISIWRSAGVTVSNGLVDGNNSPSGVGVIFENDDSDAVGGAIENVDAIHMGNGCFSGYPARFLVMWRVRCGWNR